MGDSFIFFFKKLNNEVTIMFLEGKKYTCIEELFHPFFLTMKIRDYLWISKR
jgi:hypothetical protein